MIKVCSAQYSFFYGNEIRFPYSIALLVSYAKSNPNIRSNFSFEKTFLLRDKLEEHIEQSSKCDILLLSNYIWNQEINLRLASETKKNNPNCLIVIGGPQVPYKAQNFLESNRFVDVAFHGESERSLESLLMCYSVGDSFESVKSSESLNHLNTESDAIEDLNTIPSPYLTNIAMDLLEEKSLKKIATWETFRGCPYKCSFCYWGSCLNSKKLRKFDTDRLLKEFEWFLQNKILYVEGADSNFGFFNDRDLELSEKLKEIKSRYKEKTITFRPSWTKTTNDKTLRIAKNFQEAGIFKATTLAVQSLSDSVLRNVRRKNMSKEKYSKVSSLFHENNIPTYVELIVGLPGESLESFKNGLEYIISDTKVGTVYVYNCTLLENSEMNTKEYREKFSIKSIKSPIYLTHSKINKKEISEYEDIVVGSSSYSLSDIKEMFFFSWMVQVFYGFGICDKIMEYLKREMSIGYIQFLDGFKEYVFSCNKDVFLHKQFDFVENYIDGGYSGKGWDCYDNRYGDIFWSIEELSWLRMVEDVDILFDNIENYVYNTHMDDDKIDDLIRFQKFLLSKKKDIGLDSVKEKFKYDWKGYFIGDSLKEIESNFEKKSKVKTSEWYYESIFWGRSKRNYKTLLGELNTI